MAKDRRQLLDSIVFYIFKAIFALMILIYEMSYINGV